MSDELGFVVVEWRQVGGSPYLVSDLYDDLDSAEQDAAGCREQTKRTGRRDSFSIAAVTLLDSNVEIPAGPGP